MNDRNDSRRREPGDGLRRLFDFGHDEGQGQDGRDRAVLIGLVLTAVWLLLVVMFWMFAPSGRVPGGTARLLTAVGILMPIALTWLAVSLVRAVATLRAEADQLRARLDQMRPGSAAAPPRQATPFPDATPSAQAARPRDDRPRPPAAAPRAVKPRPVAAARDDESRQQALPLEGDDSASVSVSAVDLVRALNFPDGPDDHDAIRALRAALADHDTMRLIRSAQDAVTLLAQAGVYMDDLTPRRAPPRLWREFAEGQRGPRMSTLAGLDDDDALDSAGTLLRTDEIFRDAAHHFLRQYDRALTRLAAEGDDDLLAALAETRSGRAFTLLAQSSGIFAGAA